MLHLCCMSGTMVLAQSAPYIILMSSQPWNVHHILSPPPRGKTECVKDTLLFLWIGHLADQLPHKYRQALSQNKLSARTLDQQRRLPHLPVAFA